MRRLQAKSPSLDGKGQSCKSMARSSCEALFQKGHLLSYSGANCTAAAFLNFAAGFFVVGSKLYSWVICALRWV